MCRSILSAKINNTLIGQLREKKSEISNKPRHKASTLAGTQNPKHRSQPAKELAFCSAWETVFKLTELKCNTLLTDREKGERTTLRTIAESPHKKPPSKRDLQGAFGYCLLTDTGLSYGFCYRGISSGGQ